MPFWSLKKVLNWPPPPLYFFKTRLIMFFIIYILTACKNLWSMIYSGPFDPLVLARITLYLKKRCSPCSKSMILQSLWLPIKPRPKAKRKDPRPRNLHLASTLLMDFARVSKQLFSEIRAQLKLDRNQFSVSGSSPHATLPLGRHALNIATCRHCCLFIHSKTTTF